MKRKFTEPKKIKNSGKHRGLKKSLEVSKNPEGSRKMSMSPEISEISKNRKLTKEVLTLPKNYESKEIKQE